MKNGVNLEKSIMLKNVETTHSAKKRSKSLIFCTMEEAKKHKKSLKNCP